MSSFTVQTRTKRNLRNKRMGRARKAKQAQKSTLSYAELFAECGEPRDAAAPESKTDG
ncbi:MAG: hypothetical protein K0V04_20320 [Deltaproteobacteria bacterium]|nr:hypothetical protein [Deltaproteobacteria bacterium]